MCFWYGLEDLGGYSWVPVSEGFMHQGTWRIHLFADCLPVKLRGRLEVITSGYKVEVKYICQKCHRRKRKIWNSRRAA